jgi:hypothetical protein
MVAINPRVAALAEKLFKNDGFLSTPDLRRLEVDAMTDSESKGVIDEGERAAIEEAIEKYDYMP